MSRAVVGASVGGTKALQIGYLVSEFPILSQTFVIDEVKGHLENGLDVCVLSLVPVAKTAPAQANLHQLPLSVVNVFKAGRRKLRLVEKAVVALIEVARRKKLRPILTDTRFGSLDERLTALGLARLFRRNPKIAGLDLLHCHFGPTGRYAALLKEYGVFTGPILTTFHAWELTSLLKERGPGYYDNLFRFGSLMLPISEFWIPKLIALGCDPARIRVHRMGIDCARIAYTERRLEPGQPVRLITTGRLIEKKAHTYTLQALAQLKRDHPALSFTLDVIGEGPNEAALKAEAARLGIEDKVRFHGGLPHRRTLELLQGASIFVLPSVTAGDGDMEGIPVAIMEAMAMGLPVISTFHSGIPELVEDGVSGRLVPERDAVALAEAIAAIASAPERWAALARAGRQKVERDYNRQVLSKQLEDLYRSTLRAEA